MIRLLIVDDSHFMQTVIAKISTQDDRIQVVGRASNGKQALEMIAKEKPDVVTMDLEMPEMDGLTATAKIMETHPLPVIMVSAHTKEGAKATFQALEQGAVDYLPKETSMGGMDFARFGQALREKIILWAEKGVPHSGAEHPTPKVLPAKIDPREPDLVVIGVSTGGPKSLPLLLQHLLPPTCPVVVAQHMPAIYTASYAEHLAQQTGLRVLEGQDRMNLAAPQIVILPGGRDFRVKKGLGGSWNLVEDNSRGGLLHPSVDLLFESAALAARNLIGVVLTGMGSDGAKGAKYFQAKNFEILAQTPESCVVPSMPEAVIKAGLAHHVLGPAEIGQFLSKCFASSN